MAVIQLQISEELPKELENIIIQESRKTVQQLLQSEKSYIGKEWLNLKEVQEMMGISWTTINGWRQQGLKVSEMSPRNIFIHKDELTRFLKDFER